MQHYTLPVGKDENACQLLARNGFIVGPAIKGYPEYRDVQFPDGWRLMHHKENKEAIFNEAAELVALVVKGTHPRVHFVRRWSFAYHGLQQKAMIWLGTKQVATLHGIRDEHEAKTKATAWLDDNYPTWRTALC